MEEAIKGAIWTNGGNGEYDTPVMNDHNATLLKIRTAYRAERERLMTMVPKVVIPRMVANHWKCKCGAVLYPGKPHPETKKQWVPKYCMDCGSKLNWEEA